jgi:hypothetical protein
VRLSRSPGHHRNWLDCIKTRQRPVADVEIGVRTATLVHLGHLAYWRRRKLRWNPETRRFVDDAAAVNDASHVAAPRNCGAIKRNCSRPIR